jgi:hypothetical protein
MLTLPPRATKADVLLPEDRYLPLADDGTFIHSFMGLMSSETNSCVLGGSCAALLQCRSRNSDWPRQPQDIDIYTSYPECVNLHKFLGQAIDRATVIRVERRHYSPAVDKERYCTWWIHLDIDGQEKKLEVDIKETHEDVLNRYEEVNGVPCMALKDLSKYLIRYGADEMRNYRYLDLQVFQNSGIHVSSDNSPLPLKRRNEKRLRPCSFYSTE